MNVTIEGGLYMADLSAMQVNALRREIKKRYGRDIDKRITKVVFALPGKNIAIFEAEDDFKEPEPPKPHKPEYRLYIYEDNLREEPSEMEFGALDAAMIAFCAQQKLNHAKMVLTEDDKVLQTYCNQEKIWKR